MNLWTAESETHMNLWTAESDTPTPASTDPQNEGEETNKPVRQPRYLDEHELYGFHNFTVLDSLLKRHLNLQ